ncbi:MAG TPA: Zn-dependent alcohol dehydrogenase [Spirochaetales bacterium]|nr:Zn-dependent alcohol dehydrogenase [Spirochaetales bacterium]
MKKAVMTGPGKIELQDFPVPEISDEEVLVKIEAVGICTWEQGYYKGVQGAYPFIGGHEICGIIEIVGSGVDQKLKSGDKVVVASLSRCGECYFCRRGFDNLCENAGSGSIPGEMWGPGGFAEYFVARGYEVYRIDKGVDPAVGTLAEPLACVIRSMDRSDLHFGDTAVVLGGGVMGIIHLLLAKLRGVYVIVSEPDQWRKEKAIEFGADMVVDPYKEDVKERVLSVTDDRGAEAVFFTAGGTEALEQGLTLLVKNGTLVVYGAIKPSTPVAIDPMLFHYHEINLTGVTKHTKESFREAAAILSRNFLPLGKLITEKFPFDRIEDGFKRGISLHTYRVVLEV